MNLILQRIINNISWKLIIINDFGWNAIYHQPFIVGRSEKAPKKQKNKKSFHLELNPLKKTQNKELPAHVTHLERVTNPTN